MLRIDNKIILITGLGQIDSGSDILGIGAAIVISFARQGGKIFGRNRSLKSAMVTKTMIENEARIRDVVGTDVTSSSSMRKLVDECIKTHCRIDLLGNSVGKSDPATMSEEMWDEQVER